MKEIKQHIKEQIQVHAVQQQPTQKKLLGRIKLQRGQKVYEFNTKTRDIKEAEFESVEIVVGKLGNGVRKKLVVKEGCWYETAINLTNAERKFLNKIHAINKMSAARPS